MPLFNGAKNPELDARRLDCHFDLTLDHLDYVQYLVSSVTHSVSIDSFGLSQHSLSLTYALESTTTDTSSEGRIDGLITLSMHLVIVGSTLILVTLILSESMLD